MWRDAHFFTYTIFLNISIKYILYFTYIRISEYKTLKLHKSKCILYKIVKKSKRSILRSLPSSEELPRGRPRGWYFNWTLRFMPEKCPYLQYRINNFITNLSQFVQLYNNNRVQYVWLIFIKAIDYFAAYISKTLLSCSNFPCFSSNSGPAARCCISVRRLRAVSRISCNCLGRFSFTWPCL